MNVVKLEEYRARCTIQTLESLLLGAKQGRITGLAIAWQCRNGSHGCATAGEYQNQPITALGAASRLWAKINEACDRVG